MRIETLEYIHHLLKIDMNEKKDRYENARKTQHKMEEDEDAEKSAIKEQMKYADELMKEYFASIDVLDDFESHDWV